jgi:sulfur carrier protein ThiS
MPMQVHLGGHLSWYDPQKRAWLDLSQPAPIALLDLARRLSLPEAEIAIAVVNGRAVDLETTSARDGDRVEFYPPLGGG